MPGHWCASSRRSKGASLGLGKQSAAPTAIRACLTRLVADEGCVISARLAMRIFESDLPPHLKQTAAVLALFASEDGRKIFPAVPRIAYLVGKSARQVRADVSELCDRGVLVPVTPRTGGFGRTTHYVLIEDALPLREPWTPTRKGGSPLPPLPAPQLVAEPGSAAPERRQSDDERRKPTAAKAEVGFRRSVSDPPDDSSRDQNSGFAAIFPGPTTRGAERLDDKGREPADDGNFRVIVKLTHTCMDATGITDPESSDLVEDVKRACAGLRIKYDTEPSLVRRAIELAALQRKFGRSGDLLR